MKQKNKWIFIIALFLSTVSNGQITKGNWLVGGSGNLFSYNQSSSSSSFTDEAKFTQIEISSSIGFFIADNLALGIRPAFSSIKGSGKAENAIPTNVQRYWIGPFGRYYLLNNEKQYNILTEVSYQFGFFGRNATKGNLSTFSALAGPVIYFNRSVGIEFLLGYNYTKEDDKEGIKIIKKGIQTSIGFQIHLEKE